jgi:protein import protein ZIM17
MTIEDMMRDRGELVKRGTLDAGGDVEFWEDGTTSQRRKDEINDDIL